MRIPIELRAWVDWFILGRRNWKLCRKYHYDMVMVRGQETWNLDELWIHSTGLVRVVSRFRRYGKRVPL